MPTALEILSMTYDKPLQIDRPGYSHSFDVFSPKLGRPLTLYSQNQADLWSSWRPRQRSDDFANTRCTCSPRSVGPRLWLSSG